MKSKTLLSWILAFVAAILILGLFWKLLGFVFSVLMSVVGIIVSIIMVLIIALPLFIIIKKKILK